MNADDRRLDQPIAAWLAEGPNLAAAETRRSIAAAVRRTRQRGAIGRLGPIDIARQARLLAVAALLVALAALAISAGGVRLFMPFPEPSRTDEPGASAQASSMAAPSPTFDMTGRDAVRLFRPSLLVTYVTPESFDVTRIRPEDATVVRFTSNPTPNDATPEPGTHGFVIADVTGAKDHGSLVQRVPFGQNAAEFVTGLDASERFVVNDMALTTLGGRPAWSGRVTTEGESWTHIDIEVGPNVDTLDFVSPSVIIVTDFDATGFTKYIVLVQIWADSDETLASWLPIAMELVDSLRFERA